MVGVAILHQRFVSPTRGSCTGMFHLYHGAVVNHAVALLRNVKEFKRKTAHTPTPARSKRKVGRNTTRAHREWYLKDG